MRIIWGVLPQVSPFPNGDRKGLCLFYPGFCLSARSLGAFIVSRTGIGRASPVSALGVVNLHSRTKRAGRL
jgi:hypothetical protein